MATSKPALKVRDNEIAQDNLQGMTYRQLANKYGLSKSRIHQILSKPEIRDVIDTGTNQIISLVPMAVNILRELMLDKNKARGLKAAELVLKIASIIPTAKENKIVNNIYATQGKLTLSPGVVEILSKSLARHNEDVIDPDHEDTY